MTLLLFVFTFILDGIVAPSVFGIKENFLIFVFLISLILSEEINSGLIYKILFFSILVEILLGLNFGLVSLPMFLLIILLKFLMSIFNVKNGANSLSGPSELVFLSFLGVAFIFIFNFLFLLAGQVFYSSGPGINYILLLPYKNLVFYSLIGTFSYITILRILLNKKINHHGVQF